MVPINTSAVLPYIGNDTLNVFPITFPTFENENIQVEVADADGNTETLELDTDFTLADIGKPGTNGSVTLVDTGADFLTVDGYLATGYTVYVKFNPNPSQPMKGRDWGQFAPEKIERTLDRLTMNIAAVKALAGKALALQTGDGSNPTLPSLVGNANKILQVNADESGFEYGVTSDQIEQWKIDAQTAANDAETAKEEAEAAATTTAGYVTTASNHATNAAAQAAAAQTHKDAAALSAAGAAASESTALSSVTDANTAKNAAVSAQALAEAARDDAIAAANDTTVVAGYKADTEAARDAAQTAEANAELAQSAAEDAQTAAELAANDAETAAIGADEAMSLADIFAADAQTSAEEAELYSNFQLYTKKITITSADSPFTVDDDTHADTLIIVDDTLGDVVINLPPISDTQDQTAWKVGFMRKVASGNVITVNRAGTDTIAGNTSVQLEEPSLGALFYANSPTDWALKFFLQAIAADGFVLSGAALNLGDPGTDGTWRIRQDGTQLKFEQRQAGAWVEADVLNPPA